MTEAQRWRFPLCVVAGVVLLGLGTLLASNLMPLAPLWVSAGFVLVGAGLGGLGLAVHLLLTQRERTRWEGKRERLINKIVKLEKKRDEMIQHWVDRKDLGIIGVDNAGLIQFLSRTAELTFGYTLAEAAGRSYEVLFTPPSLRRAGIDLCSAQFVAEETLEVEGKHKAGHIVPVHVGIQFGDEDHGGGFVLVAGDLTEQKVYEASLRNAAESAEQSDRAKSAFLANMSHEIRTPMTAIIGMSELCLRTGLDQVQSDYIRKIHDAGRSLLRVLNDILDFSKIEAGELAIDNVPVVIDQLIDDITPILRASIGKKPLELVFVRSPNVPNVVLSDAGRIKQILINLCNNAIKFTAQGQIVLKVHAASIPEEGRVRLAFEVTDTGIGMSPDQQAQLFRPFVQGDASTSRRYGGTGLGLSISKELSHLLNGDIAVESSEGVGSKFTFDLVCEVPIKADFCAVGLQPREAMAGLSVLVIDDNDLVRSTLLQYLHQFGFTTHDTASIRDAIQYLDNRYDVVLCDHGLEDLATAQELRNLLSQTAPGTKVILMREGQVATNDFDGIVAGVLDKPATPSVLLNAIQGVVERSLVLRTEPCGLPSPMQLAVAAARVLLVEDNLINQQVALELLQQAGFAVDIASNGAEAVSMVESEAYACVLMDIQMPVMDGFEATRIIRSEPRFDALPILAMTANAMSEDRLQTLAAGMNDHIAKPIDVAELVGKVNRVISARRVA